jgi:hypothetical protein
MLNPKKWTAKSASYLSHGFCIAGVTCGRFSYKRPEKNILNIRVLALRVPFLSDTFGTCSSGLVFSILAFCYLRDSQKSRKVHMERFVQMGVAQVGTHIRLR